MLTELSRFEILDFLEGCSIGSHLRQGVWQRCIDEFYDKLDDVERNFIFHYSVRDIYARMVHTDKEHYPRCGEKEFLAFIDRYNPARQYKVTMIDGNVVDAFLHENKYHVALNRFCSPEGIAKVEQDMDRLALYRRDYLYLSDELHGHIQEIS